MARRISLEELVRRDPQPEPWAEGENIPWDDPAFSERMLAQHLSQDHGLASRQLDAIERHIEWLVATVLGGFGMREGGRVLDLGCGPGLYTSALARRGFACTGIDYSPASIAHARATAAAEELDCRYEDADMRAAAFGVGHALVAMIFGELNAFRREQALSILARAEAALAPDGRVIIEAHTLAAAERIGNGGRTTGSPGPRSWHSAERGLFSDLPHAQLYEAFWDADRRAATERYYILDAATAEVSAYAQSMQGYDDQAYDELFGEAGLTILERFGSLEGDPYEGDGEFVVMLAAATKRAS